MSHSDSHCLREQLSGPQLKAVHSVILFCSCLIPPAITQMVVHRGLSSDSNSSWLYSTPPIAASPQRCPSLIPLVERDFQVPGMLDEVGSCVCVSMCVCLWWGLAPSGSPATPFPGPSHGRQPSSPSEDPLLPSHFPHCPSSCCHAVFSLSSLQALAYLGSHPGEENRLQASCIQGSSCFAM